MISPEYGSKAARKELLKLAEELNSEDLIPEQSYRRNHSNYPYLCCINNAACLFASKNYHVVPAFISRAINHEKKYACPKGLEQYREKTNAYLLAVSDNKCNW